MTAMKQTKCYTIECPECEYKFDAEHLVKGEVLACPDCQLNLMITEIEGSQASVELTDTDAEDWGQ